MVGNEEEARIIALWEFDEVDEYEYQPPDGFEYIGEGASRIAFRSLATGVVYKRHYYSDDDTNEFEYKAIERIKRIPLKGWRVPDATLYVVEEQQIIAMEFVEGGMDVHCQRSYSFWNKPCNCGKPLGMCSAEAWEQPQGKWRVSDLHVGNIVIDDNGIRVLIDLGA
ncbi:hypothetical protein SEA_FORREST_250 [Streptomyces phage Forrest]|nr:hypothetical protein SEA_FORREST_250 [Streptomyces phage Forrest]QZE11582.1 hypothetical protein SEA_JADA_250 [Streptomyces phage Jada]WMI33620.1 kinase [Streptomyces phage Kenrey]